MKCPVRIIWKSGKCGGKWERGLGPFSRQGGTCAYMGAVLIYTELWGDVKIEGGELLLKGRYRQEFAFFCPLEDVAAVITNGDWQIYP